MGAGDRGVQRTGGVGGGTSGLDGGQGGDAWDHKGVRAVRG